MLKVFERIGFDVTRELAQGERRDLVPDPRRRRPTASASRAATTSRPPPRSTPFFAPRSVAVIGASQRTGSIGGELFRNILRADFRGAAYPVNRGAEPVAGVRGYAVDRGRSRTTSTSPSSACRASACIDAAAEALRKGVRALCVISAGFAETRARGRRAAGARCSRSSARTARASSARTASASPSSAPRLNATFGPKALPPGNVGVLVAERRARAGAARDGRRARRSGFSGFVSIGNKADVSSNDLLEYWEDDEDTDVVLLYLESFGNPRKFGRIARRLAREKPILAMKSGTTRAGARAASSHTAALAGSDAAVDALFHQAGVIRATTLEELIDAAVLLSSQPLPRGRRVAVLTNAGGLGILCADACEAAGLELPELGPETVAALRDVLPAEASVANPIDMLGSATETTYEDVVPLVLADGRRRRRHRPLRPARHGRRRRGRTDRSPESSRGEAGQAGARRDRCRGRHPRRAVDRRGVAAFTVPGVGGRARSGLAARRAEWLRRPQGTVPRAGPRRPPAREGRRGSGASPAATTAG